MEIGAINLKFAARSVFRMLLAPARIGPQLIAFDWLSVAAKTEEIITII